jgi:putative sugar O-methyltransferase
MSISNWFCGNCSDVHGYLNVCREAVRNDEIFNNFKSIKAYQPVLEHTSTEQGLIYAKNIVSILDEINVDKNIFITKCKANDVFCNPQLIQTEEFGLISPSTLRYAFFAAKILKFLKDDNIKNILDIGGGYGGMSLVANKIFGVSDIFLNDLNDVLNLQAKYLSKHQIELQLADENIEMFYDKKFDLCISTFAFSELIKTQRDKIVNKIFKNCKYIFLVCNFINNEIFEDGELDLLLKNAKYFEYYKENHEGHPCSVFIIRMYN